MSIEKLPEHYSMQNLPTIYDEEALTALELAARTTGKVNEVVESQNKLTTDTEEHLDKQDNAITKMNDETMPAKVAAEFQKNLNNGTFEKMIDFYAGGLEARVDNWLQATPNGSTTMDAEVIDGRIGYDNKSYPNLGTAVREQIGEVYKNLYAPVSGDQMEFMVIHRNLFNFNHKDNNFNGYMSSDGETFVNSTTIGMSHYIAVEGGKHYTTNHYGLFCLWYDEKKQFITAPHSADVLYYYPAPENAAFARFLFYTTKEPDKFTVIEGESSPEAYQREDIIYTPYYMYVNPENIAVSFKNIRPEDTSFFNCENLLNVNDVDVIRGGYLNESNIHVDTPTFNMTGFIPVVPGETYAMNYWGVFINYYDEYRIFRGSLPSVENTTGIITIPENVYFIRVPWTISKWENACVTLGTIAKSVPYNPVIKADYTLNANGTLNLSGLNFTSYGDSITAQDMWQHHIKTCYGVSHTNLGIGSTTMAYVNGFDNEYPCMVNADRLQAVMDSNPDFITILGGANDAARGVSVGDETELSKALDDKDKTTFIGALSYLVETLLTWKPTLNIILMTCMVTNNTGYTERYENYAEATRTVAKYYGIPLADTARETGISRFNVTTYTSDGVHPNVAGGLKIANVVGAKINDIYRMR